MRSVTIYPAQHQDLMGESAPAFLRLGSRARFCFCAVLFLASVTSFPLMVQMFVPCLDHALHSMKFPSSAYRPTRFPIMTLYIARCIGSESFLVNIDSAGTGSSATMLFHPAMQLYVVPPCRDGSQCDLFNIGKAPRPRAFTVSRRGFVLGWADV